MAIKEEPKKEEGGSEPTREQLLEVTKRKTREQIIKDGDLVKHPEIAKEIQEYLKTKQSKIAQSEEIQEAVRGEEIRTETGKTPEPEFEREKINENTPTVTKALRDAIQAKKDAYIHRVASTGKCIIKIFGFRDGNEDIWFQLNASYRDLMIGESRLLKKLKAKEIDLRRQTDFYDAVKSRNDPEYNRLWESVIDAMMDWQQKMMELYYGIQASDFELCHAQDVAIAIEVATYREENIYPNFQQHSDSFLRK